MAKWIYTSPEKEALPLAGPVAGDRQVIDLILAQMPEGSWIIKRSNAGSRQRNIAVTAMQFGMKCPTSGIP